MCEKWLVYRFYTDTDSITRFVECKSLDLCLIFRNVTSVSMFLLGKSTIHTSYSSQFDTNVLVPRYSDFLEPTTMKQTSFNVKVSRIYSYFLSHEKNIGGWNQTLSMFKLCFGCHAWINMVANWFPYWIKDCIESWNWCRAYELYKPYHPKSHHRKMWVKQKRYEIYWGSNVITSRWEISFMQNPLNFEKNK